MTKGVLKVNAARRLPLSGGRGLLLFRSGIVSVIVGLVMFVEPAGGALALLGLIAVFAIVTGLMQIVFAGRLASRKLGSDPKVARLQRFSSNKTTV